MKIDEYKKSVGLRDYTDQIVHTLNFLKENHDKIPLYEHILVDEFQDINSLQAELINVLNPKNIFAVGDPRQSIYGWRGAKVDFILDFETLYPNSKVIQLSMNYRSSKSIVEASNKVIRVMKLPDLSSKDEGSDDVKFISLETEEAENIFVTESIQSLEIIKKEIFVLARTNKQLEVLSEELDKRGIKYIKRTVEDLKQNISPEPDQITLSTIHAIKGLEADIVYFIGASAKNHPCKASEHPVLESVKINDTYDKYAEELRLVYVAMTRARKKLLISYSGTLSSFFENDKNGKKTYKENGLKNYKTAKNSGKLYQELRDFRYEESQRLKIPAYQVFSDKTLDELCEAKPISVDDLVDINGFGPYKIHKWGNKIIRIMMDNS